MECNTLKRLIKSWYLQVQEEALAPARMVILMRDHVEKCTTCLTDSMVNREIDRIVERYLPADKIPEELKVHDRGRLSLSALAAIEENNERKVTTTIQTNEDKGKNEGD